MNSLSFNWFCLGLFSIFIQFCYMILLLLVLNPSINYLYNQLPQTPHPSIEEREVKIRDLQSLVDDLEAVLERSNKEREELEIVKKELVALLKKSKRKVKQIDSSFVLWPSYVYQQKHPLNLILLGIWTSCLSITVGVSCANTDGKIVLEALILTSAVVASLTAYTFWASKKGKNFSFLGPILFTSLFVLLLTSFLQMFFPLRSTSTAIYGGISVVVFSGFIVYNI